MFSEISELPPDPILGLTKLFADDPRAKKIDLGVGVFRTVDNKTPVLGSVKRAEALVMEAETTKVYTPPEGAPGFAPNILALLFGADHDALRAGRVTAIQTPGGCGALRVGGELLKRMNARAIYAGEPTWPNHKPLLSAAGHELRMIPYYDRATSSVLFDDFISGIEKLGPGDVLLLHGACHNPTGADLTRDQIDAVLDIAAARKFLPFIDMAYHGFANGLDEDAYVVRETARRLPEALVSYSCSKNFGLYRERIGALFMIGETAKSASAARSHAVNVARGMYSMPPAHGGAIVAEILQSPELSKQWREEAASMRMAIHASRRLLARTSAEMQMGDRLAFIERQYGMFSLLPLTEAQVLKMRETHGVYAVGSGRINLCGVNEGNVEHLCEAIREATGG
ncbi:MAG: amino acid aminotransferase [Pseudomonadota bacterium]|nr:amino acid aminotransferase [Pseudomonadota bacterium]